MERLRQAFWGGLLPPGGWSWVLRKPLGSATAERWAVFLPDSYLAGGVLALGAYKLLAEGKVLGSTWLKNVPLAANPTYF